MSRTVRRGVILGTAGLSLMFAAPAQAIPDISIGIDQDNPNTQQSQQQQTSNQNVNQNVQVQQEQAQQQGGTVAAPTPTTVVHHVDRVAVPTHRRFFVRPAARRRAFFVRGVALARTGFDVWMLGLAGAGCLAGGLVLMARRRRSGMSP